MVWRSNSSRVFFDSSTDTVTEKHSVWNDHATAAPCEPRRGGGAPHYKLQKEKGGFGGLLIFGEICKDAFFLFTAKGRVCHDDIHPILVADFPKWKAKRVFRVDLRYSRPWRSRFIWQRR